MYLYLLALLPLALGQNSSVYTVDVGEGGLIFTPNSMTANVGDQVQFNFYPQNHSVAQSNFANPCVPLNNNAIFSGFFPVANGTSVGYIQEILNLSPSTNTVPSRAAPSP